MNERGEIFASEPDFVEDRPSWQNISYQSWERIRELPEDVVRRLAKFQFGKKFDLSVFLRFCPSSDMAENAFTLFKASVNAFHLCWMLPHERKFYNWPGHPSWTDSKKLALMDKLVGAKCAEDIMRILGLMPFRDEFLQADIEKLAAIAKENERKRPSNVEIYAPSYLHGAWWDKHLPDGLSIMGFDVEERMTYEDVKKDFRELGSRWINDEWDTEMALRRKRLFVLLRDGRETVAMLMFAIGKGFAAFQYAACPNYEPASDDILNCALDIEKQLTASCSLLDE